MVGRLAQALLLLLSVVGVAAAQAPAAPAARAATGALPPSPPLVADYVSFTVGPPPPALDADPFYRKHADALGIPVLGSEKVPDAAILVARDIVVHMLAKRPDLREELIRRRWRIGVMGQTELTTDIPEHRNLRKPSPDSRTLTPGQKSNYAETIGRMTDKEYWDRRARGLGGNPTTCAEENLLGYPGTRYFGEHILVHEFAHAIMEGAVRHADPALFQAIGTAYRAAMEKGLFKGTYAATNANEYWAEGTQWWFWSNYEWFDGRVRLQSPDDLKAYDPALFELLGRVYATHHIPADVYHGRNIKPPARGTSGR